MFCLACESDAFDFSRAYLSDVLFGNFSARTGSFLNDDISLAAAGYAEQQFLVLVVSKPSAAAAAPVPVAVATVQPRPNDANSPETAPASPAAAGHTVALPQTAASALTAAAPALTGAIGNQTIAAAAPVAPVVNFATEWLDELGCICPKAVNYATCCPKGHALVPLADGGGSAPAQRLMCRICHDFTERQQALLWRVCSVAGCCGGYIVCDTCVRALQQAPAAVAAGEGFSSQVNCAA